jgi:hypothetical protein
LTGRVLYHLFEFAACEGESGLCCLEENPHFCIAMGSVTRYNGGRGCDMGKIAAFLSTIFAFFVAAPLPVVAQSSARDSGDYNNFYHFI